MRRSLDDPSLPVVALLVASAVGWQVVAGVKRTTPLVVQPGDGRVIAIAGAIAVAEGYYARGEYDGHSLPYRLNNPGALTKPALGAVDLPTWRDTGLISFPTSDMGWTALKHQVRLMLSGTSDVYRPSDTLRRVGGKYADGDANWGVNVASALCVSPDVTLSDLAPREETDVTLCPQTPPPAESRSPVKSASPPE